MLHRLIDTAVYVYDESPSDKKILYPSERSLRSVIIKRREYPEWAINGHFLSLGLDDGNIIPISNVEKISETFNIQKRYFPRRFMSTADICRAIAVEHELYVPDGINECMIATVPDIDPDNDQSGYVLIYHYVIFF